MFRRYGLFGRALIRLGVFNVATVALYRIAVRMGYFEKVLPSGEGYQGDLFHLSADPVEELNMPPSVNDVLGEAEELLQGRIPYFSSRKFNMGSPPAWFENPFNKYRYMDPSQHWSNVTDFDFAIGDIKVIWEISRFDWALVFARAFRASGDLRFLKTLNDWASDWIKNNPSNTGPNWKCGQETGIRLMQVLLAAALLNQYKTPTSSLVRFVEEHCRRIEPTMRYAIAQNNNHGTSEAAALFIGGAWLESFCQDTHLRRKARQWKKKGSRWLENRVKKLIQKDGSFSQNSINYHRLLVDTLNIVEFWRRKFGLEKFSSRFYSCCRAAVAWLYQMVDEKSGDAPNLGSNDGARLFLLSNTNYRDFRPSVQLGGVLFLECKFYSKGAWDEPLFWLNLLDEKAPDFPGSKKSKLFRDGGYVVLKGRGDDWGVLRHSLFRFRPGHADAFHFDLWHRGVNVLRDSGSFSYHAPEPWRSYFSSVKAHNTIEIDGQNQHLPLSRFLRASLLEIDFFGELSQGKDQVSWSGSYRHSSGARHRRTISSQGEDWLIIDEIDGCGNSAVLRWRLAPQDWELCGTKCSGELAVLNILSDVPIKRCELADGWESRYYLDKTPVPVLEVEVASKKATLTTTLHLRS